MCGSASSFMTFLMSLAIWCEIHQTSLWITKESCKRMSLKLSLSTHFLDTFCCYNLQQNCRKSLICKKITVYMYADANLSVWFNLYQNVYVYKNLNINWNWGNKWSAPSLLCVWWWLLYYCLVVVALYIYVVFKIVCIFFLSLQKAESFF